MRTTEGIGKFQKTHALRGELNAALDVDADYFTSSPSDARKWIIVDIEGIPVPFEVESARPKGHFSLLLKLRGVDTEAEARTFVNKEIKVSRQVLNEYLASIGEEYSDEDGVYTSDLIGFSIIDDRTKATVGEIEDVDLSTSNPLFIVNADGEILYIPATQDFITRIDETVQNISMILPEGLVDLNKTRK